MFTRCCLPSSPYGFLVRRRARSASPMCGAGPGHGSAAVALTATPANCSAPVTVKPRTCNAFVTIGALGRSTSGLRARMMVAHVAAPAG